MLSPHAHLYAPCGDRALIKRLLAVQGNVCGSCGKPMKLNRNCRHAKAATVDHVVPRALGGKHAGNQILMHRACNTDKADRKPNKAELAMLARVNAGLRGCPSLQKA